MTWYIFFFFPALTCCSFLGFPALCLHGLGVLACHLLSLSEPLAYYYRYFLIVGVIIPTSLPCLTLMFTLCLQIVGRFAIWKSCNFSIFLGTQAWRIRHLFPRCFHMRVCSCKPSHPLFTCLFSSLRGCSLPYDLPSHMDLRKVDFSGCQLFTCC